VSQSVPQDPDLTSARAEVLAIIARATQAQNPSHRDASREHIVRRVVVPAALLAVLDAVLLTIGIASGRYVLATGAGVLFVPLATVAVLGRRFAARDALRRGVDTVDAGRPGGRWTGPFASCPERGLVLAAARAAERIAGSVAWRTGDPEAQRLHLDLGAELDQLDDRAHRIAVAHCEDRATRPGGAQLLEAAWQAALDRVAVLTAYADEMDEYDRRRATALAARADPPAGPPDGELPTGRMVMLAAYLNTPQVDPPG
jgi:hypothetical protein